MSTNTRQLTTNTTARQNARILRRASGEMPTMPPARAIQADGDDAEDARHLQPFAQQVGGERRRQRHREFQHRVVQALLDLRRDPAHRDAEHDSADRDQAELPDHLPARKHAGQRRDHGEPVQHEAGRIVDEAFAFEERRDPARQPETLQHRRCRDGVRGETMAPSAKQTAQGAPGTSPLSASPTASVVVATSPIASSRIERRLRRKSRQDVAIAAGYSTAGRTIASTRSGSVLSAGQLNRTPMPMPASTSTIGYGTWMRFATQPAAIAQAITRMKEVISRTVHAGRHFQQA